MEMSLLVAKLVELAAALIGCIFIFCYANYWKRK